ncbi:transcription termination/antitermination protein NusG [bacterium]|nr:transcription termination/antitermination protein NusG [bacterium]MBU0899980.1 transcription termination/antitermination protein NusG [bacterium]MBU1153649.1 transcription termination/antitermination protein NusG [bacterium]MBU2599444.1 transcription termination/antitermination protein NusG [bacterium]
MESNLGWYVIQAYSGHENRVKSNIEQRLRSMNMEDKVKQILIPTEEVTEVRRGKKVLSTKKFFPGYILIEVGMTEEVWQVIKNVPGVFGFVGIKNGQPLPIEENEVEAILENVSGRSKKAKIKAQFEEGESLRVTDGPFVNFFGTVAELSVNKERVKLMINVLGRSTPVELQFHQVEKI